MDDRVAFTSLMPVINVVTAVRCKFIMISCTPDPANTGSSIEAQAPRNAFQVLMAGS